MLTQEEYMDVLALHRQGFTIAEIADELGYHPATISNWLKAGGPPPAREVDRSELLIDEWWAARIAQLLEINPRLLATSVYAVICAEGFEGSLSDGVSPRPLAARPPLPAGGEGVGADRDRPRGGVPVRLE